MTQEALAFDMYGTLVDPLRIWTGLEQYLPKEKAVRVAEIWRQKQLEYSFRLTVMEQKDMIRWSLQLRRKKADLHYN